MKNLKPEMIEQTKAAGSAEELLEIAKANNIEMTADEAATYFAQLSPKSGELGDDDLDAVAGGACQNRKHNGSLVRVTSGQTCNQCGGNIGRYKAYINIRDRIYCVNCDNTIIGEVVDLKYELID